LLINHECGPVLVEPGDAVGYFFQPASSETLQFTATVFEVPAGCAVGPRGEGFWIPYFGHGIRFFIKHLSEQPGERLTELISYADEPGLDNGNGTAPLPVDIQFERLYRHQIIIRLNTAELWAQRVQDNIVELCKLPPHDPEGTILTALCPLSIEIPAGKKATITVEWIELWAEGEIIQEESGDQLGTYSVFLGYVEPSSLIAEEYTK